jgi:hypothetical protein
MVTSRLPLTKAPLLVANRLRACTKISSFFPSRTPYSVAVASRLERSIREIFHRREHGTEAELKQGSCSLAAWWIRGKVWSCWRWRWRWQLSTRTRDKPTGLGRGRQRQRPELGAGSRPWCPPVPFGDALCRLGQAKEDPLPIMPALRIPPGPILLRPGAAHQKVIARLRRHTRSWDPLLI